MRLRFVHLVFAVVVLVVTGVLAVPILRPVSQDKAPEARNDGIVTNRTVALSLASDVERPTKRAAQPQPFADPTVAHYRYKVIKAYPHDRRYFTQGLVYEDGFIYEGTGLYGQSAIYKRELATGKTVKMLRLPDKYFGEGITLFGDKLIELTWQSRVGFVYKKDTFTPLREFQYTGEGWGLTQDGKRLILSDGTATLRFLDPNTYQETSRLEVRDQGRPVTSLNELEYIAGPVAGNEAGGASSLQPPASSLIFANIWQSTRIALIDPQTGRVAAWLDLTGLWTPPAEEEDQAVLNGIAYLPQTKHLLVTGKLWPRMYEIELVKE